MMIEIKGVRFYNKGAELMLLAVVEQLRARLPGVKLAMTPDGPYEKRARLGLYQKLWKYKFGMQLGNFGSLIPFPVRDRYGLAIDTDIHALLDISGLVYGDHGITAKTVLMATESKRWKKTGRSIILLPQSFGPFISKKNADAIRTIAANADVLYARDEISHAYLQETLTEEQMKKVFLSPDITILLKGETPAYFDPSRHQIAIIPHNRMSLGADETVSKNYRRFIGHVIQRMEEKGYKPFILLHDHKDIRAAEAIQADMGRRIETIREDDPLLVKALLSRCHAVVGSRFHGLVSALSQGVPTLGTGWSHKYQCLFDEYGCGENLISMDTLDIDLIDKKIENLLDPQKREVLKAQLKSSTERQKKKVEQMWDTVIAILKSKETRGTHERTSPDRKERAQDDAV